MNYRPHFKEYVAARLVTIAVAIFIVVSVILLSAVEERTAYIAIALIALSFSVFIYAIYRGSFVDLHHSV